MARGIILAVLFLTGAAAMQTIEAQEKKAGLPPLKAPYESRVKWEQLDQKTGAVAATVENVDAFFKNDKWQVRAGAKFVFTRPKPGDRVTDDKGQVWVVDAAMPTTANERYILTVTKQKKP